MLDPVIHKMITYVQNLEEKDLKDKVIFFIYQSVYDFYTSAHLKDHQFVFSLQRLVSIPDLLSAIKLLCMRFQRELVTVVDDLRLDTLLRMLKTPHFSTKMNSLKEVSSLDL